jgi:hypothetical protein
VRRHGFDHEGFDEAPLTMWEFIRMWSEDKANTKTYLYFRNGAQVYYLETGIEFGAQLFPDRAHARLEDQDLWVAFHAASSSHIERIVTTADVEHETAKWRASLRRYRERRREHNRAHRAWRALPKAEREKAHEPWWSSAGDPQRKPHFEPLTPESVYYDDAMKMLADDIRQHNRLATVLQGVLDRSPALQPHPPWQLFTAEGFAAGVELVYDDSRALVPGDPPDFAEYCAIGRAFIQVGTWTIGQEDLWLRAEAKKENTRRANDWRRQSRYHERDLVRFRPYGNPGPGRVAQVVKVMRNGDCIFEWKRERRRTKYRWDAGYTDKPITCRIRVPREKLFNVDAYQPGDYKRFFADPQTREDYLIWAPLMLCAEDHCAGKHSAEDETC